PTTRQRSAKTSARNTCATRALYPPVAHASHRNGTTLVNPMTNAAACNRCSNTAATTYSTISPLGDLLDHEAADRQLSGARVLRRETEARHFADVDRRAGVGAGRLEVRIRTDLIERNAHRLPCGALQIHPMRIRNAI